MKIQHAQKYIERFGLPTLLAADQNVFLEENAFVQLQALITNLQAHTNPEIKLEKMSISPDFHKGSPIPVGITLQTSGGVFPSIVGSDIGCGMQMIVLKGLEKQHLIQNGENLKHALRESFFAGKRKIAMNQKLQSAIFRHGVNGMLECDLPSGLWKNSGKQNLQKFVLASHQKGGFSSGSIFSSIQNYIQKMDSSLHYDAHLGTVGGGNHFVEIGYVDNIVHGSAAYHFGLEKGDISILIHSGSLNFGKSVAQFFIDLCKNKGGSLSALQDKDAEDYFSAMQNAANFAFVNRVAMGLMVTEAISQSTGKSFDMHVAWDAPHNLAWKQDSKFIHRKGSTPALGASADHFFGQPVLVPGSMGDKSWILAGNGNQDFLCSVPHGAGRSKSRKNAQLSGETNLDVVLPIDLQGNVRNDIRKLALQRLGQESPEAYKAVDPAVECTEKFGIAERVASHRPLITIKGL